MELVFFTLWVAIGVYCFMCIWVPEMRFLRWRGGGDLGTLSHACFAWFFLSPLLITTGVISPQYSTLVYIGIVFSVFIMIFGIAVDKSNQKRND